jgi:hypothetical protein
MDNKKMVRLSIMQMSNKTLATQTHIIFLHPNIISIHKNVKITKHLCALVLTINRA